ncbi:MAG: helix-hairpin-helix domain-containing protein [Caldilineaceae bacterium]
MQTLNTLKAKGQASFSHLRDTAKEQPDEMKVWGVTAGSAVVGAVAVNAAARGVVAILAALAAPPVAVIIGAIGGGYLGWNYVRNRQATAGDMASADPVAQSIDVMMIELPEIEAQEVEVTPVELHDDLQKINGIGPVYASRLHAAGIQTFDQLAELSTEQIRQIIGPMRSGHMIDPATWIAEASAFATATAK